MKGGELEKRNENRIGGSGKDTEKVQWKLKTRESRKLKESIMEILRGVL